MKTEQEQQSYETNMIIKEKKEKDKNQIKKGEEVTKSKEKKEMRWEETQTSTIRPRCSSSFRRSGNGGSRYTCSLRIRIAYKKEKEILGKNHGYKQYVTCMITEDIGNEPLTGNSLSESSLFQSAPAAKAAAFFASFNISFFRSNFFALAAFDLSKSHKINYYHTLPSTV